MIAYAVVLLTDLEDTKKACTIDVQYGLARLDLCGELVRSFIRATNHAYHDYPFHDCLTLGLETVPPELRPILAYLYETLREVFVWHEQDV